jgi:hypothetical protein
MSKTRQPFQVLPPGGRIPTAILSEVFLSYTPQTTTTGCSRSDIAELRPIRLMVLEVGPIIAGPAVVNHRKMVPAVENVLGLQQSSSVLQILNFAILQWFNSF